MAFPSNPVNGQTVNINNIYYTYSTSIPGWSVTASFNDNITAANVTVSNNVTASGFIGSGAALSALPGANVTGTVANATYATSAGSATTATSATSATSATTAGTVTTAAQPNITSVGTLTSVAVTGNVQGGNLNTAGLVSATGTITGSQFNGSGAGLSALPGANVTGTLSVNTTGSAATLTTSRNINGVAFNGSADITVTAAAGTLTGTTLNSSVVTSSLTTVGALNSGSITSGFGAIDIGTDSLTCGSIVNSNANGVGNIGSSTTYFNTVFAKATSAQYADLAEIYVADDDYTPGTVVVFGGAAEITTTTTSHDSRVAGVISTDPAYLMNTGVEGLPVAFTGRVPTLVQGPVGKGDIVVTSAIPGVAQKLETWAPGVVIGKSLGTIDDDAITLIEVVVGRF